MRQSEGYASIEKAVNAYIIYRNVFLPLSKKYNQERILVNAVTYQGPIGDYSYNSVPKELRKSSSYKRLNIFSWAEALNQLELIAGCFISGKADKKTGYRLFGQSYCSATESYYDLISISNINSPRSKWKNIIELYEMWRPQFIKPDANNNSKTEESLINPLAADSLEILINDLHENVIEGNQPKLVYSYIGDCLNAAQKFETAILLALFLLNSYQNKTISFEELSALESDLRSKTLGNLLKKFHHKIRTPPEVIKIINDALETRNFLVHDYCFERSVHFLSENGHKQMISELRDMTQKIVKADQIAMGIVYALCKKTGLKPEDIQKQLKIMKEESSQM